MRILAVLLAVAFALPFLAQSQETESSFNVTVMSCVELQCINQKGVFLLNESAYIDYNSSLKEISYYATLTFPDGTKYQAAFPSMITSNATGNYTIEMVAWKEGYGEVRASRIVQFVDSRPEASQNPPRLDWLPFLIVGVLIVWSLAYWGFFRRKKKERPEKEKRDSGSKKH